MHSWQIMSIYYTNRSEAYSDPCLKLESKFYIYIYIYIYIYDHVIMSRLRQKIAPV